MLGFGYPSLTAAYLRGDMRFKLNYTPIFTSLHQRRLTAPVSEV